MGHQVHMSFFVELKLLQHGKLAALHSGLFFLIGRFRSTCRDQLFGFEGLEFYIISASRGGNFNHFPGGAKVPVMVDPSFRYDDNMSVHLIFLSGFPM